jgi:hypothetical protein
MNNFVLVSIISILIVSIISIISISYAEQNKIENISEKPIKFFAIQHAQSGSISDINQTFTLELHNISDKTILFSYRPERIVKATSTADFIGNWSIGIDNFTANPPNAVFIVYEDTEKQHIPIIELFSPEYDVNNKILKYDISSDNPTSIDLPNEFGQSTLVIDEVGQDHIIIRYTT